MSPKFLIGESYGGTRAAALVEYLQTRFGMYFNGVMLVAPALNMEALYDAAGSLLPDPLFLPVYAATAHYHGLFPDRTLDEAVTRAHAYADEYRGVLARGQAIDADARAAAVGQIAAITGLSEDYVDRANLRLEHTRVYAELLRSQRLVTGRLDTRFTGPADHYIHEQMPYDPFMAATFGPYAAALHHYLHAELEYRNDAIYEVITDKVHPWSYKEYEGRAVDVADKLATAMIANPHLAVLVAMGRYDGGVPAEAITYSLDQMAIPVEARVRIETHTYPAGHMMYVHEESRLALSADIAAFIRRATSRAS
jgi:carboxypeptidase C (cathepsin A)